MRLFGRKEKKMELVTDYVAPKRDKYEEEMYQYSIERFMVEKKARMEAARLAIAEMTSKDEKKITKKVELDDLFIDLFKRLNNVIVAVEGAGLEDDTTKAYLLDMWQIMASLLEYHDL